MLCEAKSKERSLNLLCELNLEIEARVRESHTQNLFKGSSYVEIRSERFSFCDLCHSHLSLSHSFLSVESKDLEALNP